MNDIHSLSHSKWNCKYHIVFAPKYRRQAIYGQIKADIGKILRMLCEQKKVNIIEAEACPDHIHMLVEIPPHLSVAQFMGYLKGKSSLMIFDRHANLKYKYGNRHFWCRGYYVDTVGKNKKAIEEHIRNQLQEDIANDQLTLKTASKNDIWLHTQNIPGSHVILVTDGAEPSETAIREAAVLAAYHSKARDSAQVPVDFTKVRFVKKPGGAKPGMVIFTNQQTLYIKPDAALCHKLEVKD